VTLKKMPADQNANLQLHLLFLQCLLPALYNDHIYNDNIYNAQLAKT